jgi:Mg-chelatase subunit ChlD
MNGIDRYEFLASAIAGRKVSLQLSVKNDALAYCDGRSIVVPANAERADSDSWLAIAAQAALIGAGALDAALLRQLIGRRVAAQRYVYLEMLRASRLLADRLPWLFSQRSELLTAPLTDSAAASLSLAFRSTLLPPSPEYFGTVRPLLALRHAVGAEGLAAVTRKQQLGEIKRREVRELGDEEDSESSALLRLFQSPFSAGNPLSDLLNSILGAGVAKGKQASNANDNGGTELPVGRVERTLRRGVNAVLAKLPFELLKLDVAAESQTLSYPEWDDNTKSYRRDWVSVAEVDAWRPDGLQDLSAVLLPPPRELRRQLAGLGLDHELHRRQSDGSDLDVGALIECAIELRTGHSPPALQVYRASRRTRRDLAVAIVLDISGSTGEQRSDGGSIFNDQLRLAYQLGRTFDSLGDAVAMFGFHSWGRKLARVVHLKGHEERWSARVAERLALLEPVGFTRIGTAIRHGSRLLHSKMRLPNRLLVLITDGIAYDLDYELSFAEADARKALEEARATGTACVALSVAAGTGIAKLTTVFGGANILAVDKVSEVTGRIRDVCRQALNSVSRRRY